MKQTAVEWLESRISILIPEDIGSQLMFKSNIAKAKEMEKEQHSVTYGNSLKDMINKKIDFEQYYNETFNK